MNTITQTSKQIGLLTIALTIALVANFAYGQWANPTAAPTGNNAAAPINIGVGLQSKDGDIGAFDMIAVSKMRSDLYCDRGGGNCVTAQQMFSLVNNSSTPPPPTCTTQTFTVSGCQANSNCPSGSTPVGGYFSVNMNCGEDGYGFGRSCQRQVCN